MRELINKKILEWSRPTAGTLGAKARTQSTVKETRGSSRQGYMSPPLPFPRGAKGHFGAPGRRELASAPFTVCFVL